jgi:pimeloyl-ACP methyl ester carboxylesterase
MCRSKRLPFAVLVALLAAIASSTAHAASPLQARVQGHGSPVVLLPGLGCAGEVWSTEAAHLALTQEVHVLTLPGFAGVAPVKGAWLPSVHRALVDYFHAQNLKHATVIGHSLGGFLAFELAVTEPALVGRVVAVDGVPYLPALMNPAATPTLMEPQAKLMREAMKAAPAQFATNLHQTLAWQLRDDDARAAVEAQAVKSDVATCAEAMYALMTTDLRPRLAALKAPALLVGAGNGQPLEATEAAYRAQLTQAPGVGLVLHPTSRHFLMLDEPAFLEKTIDTFLAEAK